MQKEFEKWNKQKNILDKNSFRLFFHEREVWFVSLGANIGFEQDGKGEEFLRPVIIVKKFNNDVFWGIPTTKRSKTGEYYFSFSYKDGCFSMAILSQLRLIDAKRLKYKIGTVKEIDFLNIKRLIISFLK